MTIFALNLLFAIGWSALFGNFSLANLIAGYAVGFIALWLLRPLHGSREYFHKLPRVVKLIGFFLWDLTLSSLRVAWDVITPSHFSNPGIIAVPLDVKTDAEIAIFANLVSLTPGTLSLDVSRDRKFLYVHAMFADDPEGLKRDLKAGMERHVLEVTR